MPRVKSPAASYSAPTAEVTRAMRGSNQRGMRQFNERIVLQAIRLHGAIPKADLARLTQLSTQTVSVIVERLLDDGLLLKQERLRGRIGQPSVPLSLNPEGAFSVGVQVGRRSMEVLVLDFAGQIRYQHVFHYEFPDPDEVLRHIASALMLLRQQMGERWARVVGLGLSAPLFMHQWADLLGPEAAPAMRPASNSTTLAPPRASSSAADSPVKPPPITATSHSPSARQRSPPANGGVLICQYESECCVIDQRPTTAGSAPMCGISTSR